MFIKCESKEYHLDTFSAQIHPLDADFICLLSQSFQVLVFYAEV